MVASFRETYQNKTIFITGQGGFKGSWLSLWLAKMGARVIGYGHPPRTSPNHYSLVSKEIWDQELPNANAGKPADLLSFDFLSSVLLKYKPDLILHLAAKAIVARTFTEPRETFENNVMGAVNILESARLCPSVKGVVMIVTDKIYEDKEWNWGYRENDELGGAAPYDASKVCVEHVIRCYRESFGMNIAAARAGNVIGGGDWSEKRLLPDIVRATAKGEKVIIHTPNATRPFQHVLEALSGYLTLGQFILEGRDVNSAWNFGPEGDPLTVLEVLQIAKSVWPAVDWEVDCTPTHPFMQYLLKIDSTKARKELGWRSVWTMREAVANSIMWYKTYYNTGAVVSKDDIAEYEFDLREFGN